MYRLQPNGTYRMVKESYYKLNIDEQLDSFTCGNVSLQPSERFSVRQGDLVGFCEETDTVRYYVKSGSLLLRWDASGCSDLSSSGMITEREDRALLLSALIGMYVTHDNHLYTFMENVMVFAEEKSVDNKKGSSFGSGSVAAIIASGLGILMITTLPVIAFAFYHHKRGEKQAGI